MDLPPPPPPIHHSIAPSPTRIPIPLSPNNTTPRRPSLTPSSPSPSNSPTLIKSSIPLPIRQPSPSSSSSSATSGLPPLIVMESPAVVVIPTTPAEEKVEEEVMKPEKTTTTYLEDLHHNEEEELENIAAKIASVHVPSVGFTSSLGTSLRRRVTAVTSSGGSARNKGNESIVVVSTSSNDEVEGDEEKKEAIRIMEDEEVARFLDRVSKQVSLLPSHVHFFASFKLN